MSQGLIKYIVIIAIILLIAVVSQQAFVKQWGQNIFSKVTAPVQGFITKGASWVSGNVASKIGGEVQNRGDMIKKEIDQEKKNISENIFQKTKNYFSGIANSILRPGTSRNCQSAESSPLNQPNP